MRLCRFVVVVLTCICLCLTTGYAESSGKTKKADKLFSEGKVSEAMEEYQKILEKYTGKSPEAEKEAREGIAKCLLKKGEDSYREKNYIFAKTNLEEVITKYKDTGSVSGAYAYLVQAQYQLCLPIFEAGKHEECLAQCKAVQEKVPKDTQGLDKLLRLMGDSMYFIGHKALESEDYASCISSMERVIGDYPQSQNLALAKKDLAEALFRKGSLDAKEKRYADALSAFDRVIKDFQENKEVILKTQKEVVKVLVQLAEEDMKAMKYEDALTKCIKGKGYIAKEDELQQTIKTVMKEAGGKIFEKAQALMKEKKYKEALPVLELSASSSDDPDLLAEYKYNIAVCLSSMEEEEQAVKYYTEAGELKVAGHSDRAYRELYLIYTEKGNDAEALKNIKAAVAIGGKDADLLFAQAMLLKKMGNPAEAKASFQACLPLLQKKAAETFIDVEDTLYALGMTYLNLERYTEASVEFDKALKRDPGLSQAKKALAEAQFKDKNYQGAIKTYGALIDDYSKEFESLQIKVGGIIEKTSKEYMSAAKELEEKRRAIALFHYNTGLSYEELGDYEKATAECRLGLEGVTTQEAASTLKRIQEKMRITPATEKTAP